MNVIVTDTYYNVKRCEENPNSLFVFGDNQKDRRGFGGQSCIRNEINAVGIATKKNIYEYFSDNDYWDNIKVINNDIFKVKEMYINDMYTSLIFPSQGLGTGLSNLHVVAPRTFLYLCERLLDEFNFNNLSNLKSK